MASQLLDKTNSLLFLVDIQERLAPAIWQGADAVTATSKLVDAAHVLGIDLLVSEQYRKGLGLTLPALRTKIPEESIFEKIHFSCVKEPGISSRLQALGKKQIVICGMECHVCVLQTVLDLREAGYHVFVVADAVSSRTVENRTLGLARMEQAGAVIVSSEMVLFEWLEKAGTDEFKSLIKLIK